MFKTKDLYTFLKCHLGKGCLAPLTGQDTAALHAFVALAEMYVYSDDTGRRSALAAMRLVLDGAQAKCHPLFKKAIPFVRDWSDEERMWAEINPMGPGQVYENGSAPGRIVCNLCSSEFPAETKAAHEETTTHKRMINS